MTQQAGVPLDFWGRIQRMIEDAVAKLARSGMLRNASISGGALVVKNGGQLRVEYPAELGGAVGVYFGDLSHSGGYLGTGLIVEQPDGTNIMQVHTDDATGGTTAALRDGEGKVAFSTQTGGSGIDHPYFGHSFFPSRYANWTVQTTSPTFETLFTSFGYRQHSGVFAWTCASMDTAGTTGEVQVLVNGTPIDDPASIGFALSTNYHGTGPVDGDTSTFMVLEIQGRVTSGAGALRVGGGGWLGRPNWI